MAPRCGSAHGECRWRFDARPRVLSHRDASMQRRGRCGGEGDCSARTRPHRCAPSSPERATGARTRQLPTASFCLVRRSGAISAFTRRSVALKHWGIHRHRSVRPCQHRPSGLQAFKPSRRPRAPVCATPRITAHLRCRMPCAAACGSALQCNVPAAGTASFPSPSAPPPLPFPFPFPLHSHSMPTPFPLPIPFPSCPGERSPTSATPRPVTQTPTLALISSSDAAPPVTYPTDRWYLQFNAAAGPSGQCIAHDAP